MVEVVNIRTCNPPWGQPGDVRIDRLTIWGNPYRMTDDSDYRRDFVCYMYVSYFMTSELDIAEIANAKRLGCWCKPKRCHGDFLKKMIDEHNAAKQMKLV
jgi:hypothetical protein